MRINNDRRVSSYKSVRRNGSSSGSASASSLPSLEPDQVALNQVREMVDRLITMPEVRDEVAELAKRLARDANYPSADIVDELSKILAKAIRL
ncbi:MAG: hypothetical protein E1N59_136 [Puniceicoccaceae bacterium 5H]|nr:MAG: hypothetical protein E1N59_136 [Puniceicoccaceae bacterium 5H]